MSPVLETAALAAAAAETGAAAAEGVASSTAEGVLAESAKEAGNLAIEQTNTAPPETTKDLGRAINIFAPTEGPLGPPWERLPTGLPTIEKIPPFAVLTEKENSPYEHMKETLKNFFKTELGIDIKIEPLKMPEKGKADIVGLDRNGNLVVGEIKTEKEAGESASAWWSHWKETLSGFYSDAINALSTEAKGWCAVIDGQLREYCETLGVDSGYLVVEKGEQFAENIEESLKFLKEEGRIKDFAKIENDAKGNSVYRVDY